MGNQITKINKKMYHVTEECKKCYQENNELKEEIRNINIDNNRLIKYNNKNEIEIYNLNQNIQKTNKKRNLELTNLNYQINKIKADNKLAGTKIKLNRNELNEKNKVIKNLSNKLLENNCKRNNSLASRIQEINNDLNKCTQEKIKLSKKTNESITAMQNCEGSQVKLENDNNYYNNLIKDYKNDLSIKDNRIVSSDRHILTWRSISFIFFVLFFIFMLMYIFKNTEKK